MSMLRYLQKGDKVLFRNGKVHKVRKLRKADNFLWIHWADPNMSSPLMYNEEGHRVFNSKGEESSYDIIQVVRPLILAVYPSGEIDVLARNSLEPIIIRDYSDQEYKTDEDEDGNQYYEYEL